MPSDPWDEPEHTPDPWDEPGDLGPVPQDMSNTAQPPDAISRDTIDPVSNPKLGASDAVSLAMGQGAFGLGDEITSAIRAVRDTARTPERKWEDTLKLYRAYKANQARDMRATQAQHPVAWMAGNLAAAAPVGIASAALAPAAAVEAAPWGANTVINMGQSIAQNFGQDTLTPGNVLGDVAFGEAMALPMRVAQHGVRRTIGEALQMPQKGVDAAADRLGGTKIGKILGSQADDLGDVASKRVKDLRTAQQSYLTQAGKQAAAADAAIGGSDVPSKLAKAASEGRATVGPGVRDFSVPEELGFDFQDMWRGGVDRAIKDFGGGFVPPGQESPSAVLRSMGHTTRAADLNRAAVRNMADDEMELVRNAKQTLERWQAAKAAQKTAEAGGEEAAAQLARIKIGRGAIQTAAGVLGGGAAGHGVAGTAGAVLGALSGKQLGKGALQGIDIAGEAGQALAAMSPTVERLASGSGPLSKAAQWVLSGQGPAFVARLATLADLPEFQDEVAADTR